MVTLPWTDSKRNWNGFLVDQCVQEIAPILYRMGYSARVTRKKNDSETVFEAREESRTVVTAKENPFLRDTQILQALDHGKDNCNDSWGLLILPHQAAKREGWFPKLKAGIPVGKEVIPWSAVAYANLCVSLRADGQISLRRLRRCDRCTMKFPIAEEWFRSLGC
jgi:hypothetical protein